MTENKRYTILDSPNTMPFVCDRFENDETIAEVHSDNVNQLCDLLNDKEEEITSLNSTNMELEDANARLEERIKQQEELISEQAIQLDYLKDENKQLTEQIKELKKENEGIQNKVWYLIAYLELKHGIDKKEIKEYWNKGCDVE